MSPSSVHCGRRRCLRSRAHAHHRPRRSRQTQYGVTADVANAPALLKAATYTFTPGQPSYDKTVDQAIISAIDREMSARGVTKVTSGPLDVVVTYLSVRRTDVDLKSKPSAKDGTLREYR